VRCHRLLPQTLADGLLLGGVYAIVAVALTMTFGQAQSHPTKAQ
jgi:branched-subunit amino acid ABC-type transport system permease component